jgi:tRNA modification GTPase
MSLIADTIAALATPAGTSALALIRISGGLSQVLVTGIFGENPRPRTARHADYRDRCGVLVDDVVFTYFPGPHSFTGEDALEISCHGNPFIARKILTDLLDRGCRLAEPGEFSQRAFLHGRMELSQAEAIMDLIQARSERALAAANQQLRGALGRKMDGLIDQSLKLLAHVEAYIDFPEEDLPPHDQQGLLEALTALQAGTSQLLATSHYGSLLRDGIKTVIIGEPNAGKSSLLNRLVGHERALVSPEPGTTRDYLEAGISIGAHWLRLIDTAGLNLSPGPLEQRGIDKAREQAAIADLFLWVIDAARPLPLLPHGFARWMTPANTIVAYNKSDLSPVDRAPLPQPFSSVSISALTGHGFDTLQAALNQFAESFQTSSGDELIAINVRHAQALDQARACLESAREKLSDNICNELLASDLRDCLSAYGQISGKIDNERMLDQLFASFCIGK